MALRGLGSRASLQGRRVCECSAIVLRVIKCRLSPECFADGWYMSFTLHALEGEVATDVDRECINHEKYQPTAPGAFCFPLGLRFPLGLSWAVCSSIRGDQDTTANWH